MGTRITVLVGLFALIYGTLGFRFYDIQVDEGDRYGAQASVINATGNLLTPRRGSIYFSDRNGEQVPAAINKAYPIIYAVPDDVEDAGTVARALAPYITDKTYEELEEILSKEGDPYEPLIRRPSEDQSNFFEDTDLQGINIGKGLSRYYPLGKIGAHVLGFASTNELVWDGQYGVEDYYNQRLGGVAGESWGDHIKSPLHGQDIQLTINADIQVRAEDILQNLVADYSGSGGTVIVAEPDTGKILAMASVPNFDPNRYGESEISNFMNPAVQSVYEPGSIFKVITMAAALDAGKITPDTTYYDSGELTLNGHTIKNWDEKANGTISMTNVIERSVNTGAAFAERQLGHENFYEYLERFGFKDPTAIDLPGEVVGSLLPLEEDVRDINYATASFGQGISTTPIRLLMAISSIANGGNLMRPYVNAENQPERLGRTISREASRQVVDMMVSAVDKATIARIDGYAVAGKTGTAQVPRSGGGGYADDEVINTYIGFAPAYDPEFIILIRLDKPYGAPLAGLTVVPAFRELAEFVINHYNIPPDRIDIAGS
ncbi:MAG: penicillin-binding protein 2 [Candidatus Colwellbacteria bacterium]|nr:penicillin-binding protein 2 [Candidatus Colwellbacteria bacterium]